MLCVLRMKTNGKITYQIFGSGGIVYKNQNPVICMLVTGLVKINHKLT